MITSRVLVAALLSGFAAALPHRVRDSSINEPAVSAPNGTPITEGTPPAATSASVVSSGSSYGSSMDSGSYGSNSYGSSMDSSYGSSMDSSYGSSMDSSYGSSMDSGSYGSSMNYGSYSSSSDMSDDMSTSMMMDSTSTSMMMDSTSTTVAYNSYQTPTYGSGNSNWGSYNQGSNYNDCVSQCVAQYGSAPQPWTPPPTQTSSGSSDSSSGSGATHTVIVAPTQGLLRFVPAFVNASVGDTVRFMWGANTHTVTKSSELTPCNKTSDSPFTSGVQLKGFTFDQVVNDTNPTFYYCGVPTHCQQGMFGIINPPSAYGANTSLALMMSNMTATDPNLGAYSSMVANMTQNDESANSWGSNLDLASLPTWSHNLIAENVLYGRSFIATNPSALQKDGTFDFNAPGLMFPMDLSNALSSASPDAGASASSTAGSSSTPATSAGASAASGTSSSAAASTTPNGAAAVSPKFAVALAAAAASFLLL